MNSISRGVFGLLTLLGLSVVATGCIIAIGADKETTPAPPPIIITDSADAATIAEIDAAAKLNMDEDRMQALTQIAERNGLAASVQVHLVNTTYRRLSFDNHRTLVLSKVIARSDFSDATRHAIVSQLNKLSFDNNRQMILQQINERLKTSSAR